MRTLILKASDPSSVEIAARILRRGGVVIYPTETAYGMAVDIAKSRAVSKIYKIKQRIQDKRLTVIFGSLAMTRKCVIVDEDTKRLSSKFMPGPLTLVSKVRSTCPIRKRLFSFNLAWRIPGHSWALKLANRFEAPISATSANISDQPPIYKISEVTETFDGKVDLIVNGGNLKPRKPSTIFDVTNRKIIRKGPISKKEIMRVLGKRS